MALTKHMQREVTKQVALLLASGSPRRRALLRLTGWASLVHPVDVDEQPHAGESPMALARRLAREKALAVSTSSLPVDLILAADTIVVFEDQVLGKPRDADQARAMLTALRGCSHEVITAVALIERDQADMLVDTCSTSVPMRSYSRQEVETYIRSGSPLDKAGAYGIQDDGFSPVDLCAMQGCYANVMGLPLCHLLHNARRFGFEAPVDVPRACQQHNQYECDVYSHILDRQ